MSVERQPRRMQILYPGKCKREYWVLRKDFHKNNETSLTSSFSLRDVGSPAMCLALVASGVADAYFNFGLHCWDMAAGVLIVTEAGGVAMDPAINELDIMARRCLVASSEHLALQLGNSLQQIYPRPRDDEAKPPPGEEVAAEMRDFTAQTDFPDTEESSSSEPIRYN